MKSLGFMVVDLVNKELFESNKFTLQGLFPACEISC